MHSRLRLPLLLASALLLTAHAAVSQVDFSGVTLNTDPVDVYQDLERVVRCISPNLPGGCAPTECEELARSVEMLWMDLTDFGKLEVLKLFGDFYLDQFYGDEPWRSGVDPSFGTGAWKIATPDERVTGAARVTKFEKAPFDQDGFVTMTLGASLFVVPGEGYHSILVDDSGYWIREIRSHGRGRWKGATTLPPHPTLFSSWYCEEFTSILDFFVYEMEIVLQRYLIEEHCTKCSASSCPREEFRERLGDCYADLRKEQSISLYYPLSSLCATCSPEHWAAGYLTTSRLLEIQSFQDEVYTNLMDLYSQASYAEQVFASWLFELSVANNCAVPEAESEYSCDMPFEWCAGSVSQYYLNMTQETGMKLRHDLMAKERALGNIGCSIEI